MAAMPLKAEVKQDIGNHECGRTIGTVAASGADLTFATPVPLAREANVKSKAPLATNTC
jgi:hypothetical protein